MGSNVSGLRLKVSDLYAAPRVTDELINRLDARNYMVSNWTDEYGSFFQAIQMEKTMMFVILVLIIAVAAFNLVSSLVMVVTDKRAEIAILRTLGASPGSIMATFMVQGCVVGVVGTLLGLIGGVALAWNVTTLVEKLQRLLQTQFINSNIYFINYLPSRLDWSDVAHITFIALGMALVATIYPAWTAARTQPAEALRYE
jgi:lipoprotein-releasing system permease protein